VNNARFRRARCEELCPRLKTCVARPTIGTEAKENCKAKQNLFSFNLNILLQVFFFYLFKSTEIKVETSFDRVKTQRLLKLITKPIMLPLF